MQEQQAIPGFESSDDENLSRRYALGWIGKLGVTIVAGSAGILRKHGTASADGFHYGCCHLANPHSVYCVSNCDTQVYSWTCCSGISMYRCYECWDDIFGQPLNCWNGAFKCSKGAIISQTCWV